MEESKERPLRAIVVVADAFHDSLESLDEAAIAANELRRMGTRVFLIQLGNDPTTRRKLENLAKISGGLYARFDLRTQERQFAELWAAVATFTAGGEEAVRAKGGAAARLLLEHFKQTPMPIIEEHEGVRVAARKTGAN